MKTKSRVFALFLAILMTLSAVACGTEKPEPTDTSITLTDQVGRTVTLEKEAERVVSGYYISTYAMLALGQGDKLVGIEKKADTRPIYAMAKPELLSLPAVGTMKELNCELIVSLDPDLVILPKKLMDAAAPLEAVGIPVLFVNPETDADLRAMLSLIGRACGATEKADALFAFCDAKRGEFDVTEKPSVLCLGNSSFLSAAPTNMYQNDLITLAGGVNAYSSDATYWQQISYETILALDPDWLVIPAGASYTAEDIRGDVLLSQLRAVKENRILSVPNVFEEWDSPIPSGILGVLWLRSALHPSDYTNASLRKDIVAFYETFYGFTPSSEALDAIR